MLFRSTHAGHSRKPVENRNTHADAHVGTEVIIELGTEIRISRRMKFLIIRTGDSTEQRDGRYHIGP